jgi:hypothetical protein
MKYFLSIVIVTFSLCLWSHEGEHNEKEQTWKIGDQIISGDFLLLKDGIVYLQTEDGATKKIRLNDFTTQDQAQINSRYQTIEKLNTEVPQKIDKQLPTNFSILIPLCILFLGLIILSIYFFRKRKIKHGIMLIAMSFSIFLYSFTDPNVMNLAFNAFQPNVITSWDANYFYVESKGIPTTHDMMVGIASNGWQQQVPIPQCYYGDNAWSIPLNPILAATPVPVNAQHFTRGAIAVAVNGVPIFNPFTNQGVDAFLDGQLDNWGGHCGRADDYHYHTAPLHLYGTTSSTLPIAYALDGYAVFGALEPDGISMTSLDANHGHNYNGEYHYHGTANAPYMIGNMVGQVTEDATAQIIPQAAATPVRPAQTPLNGALIASLIANGSNGYILSYLLNNQNYQVSYSWTTNGLYTFNFINPSGTTTSNYNGFIPCDIQYAGAEESTLLNKSFHIYPIPSQHTINIQLKLGQDPKDIKGISIYSNSGTEVFHSHHYEQAIDLSNQTKGIYFIVIKTSKGEFKQKLILQ